LFYLARLAPSGRSLLHTVSNKRIVRRPLIESPQNAPQNFSQILMVDFLKKGKYLALNRGGAPDFYRRSMSCSEGVFEGHPGINCSEIPVGVPSS
jgi:hypothetical protein